MKQPEQYLKTILFGLFAFLLLLSALFVLKGWAGGHFQSAEKFRDYVAAFGFLAPAVLTLIQALQVVLPVLPGFLGCVVGAGMFGVAGGFLCNYIGISAGSILAFFLARRFGEALAREMIHPEKYKSFVAWLNRRKSYTVILFLCILLPLAPDDFLCYFSGLAGMAPKKFIWIIILGKPWCILAYCLAFARLF